MDDTNQLLFFS